MLSSVLELLPNFKSTYFASMNPLIIHWDDTLDGVIKQGVEA